jgi:NCS1 family nucleobase:cation symporter-1
MPVGRIFSVWDMACLWVGLVVGVPTYYMAGSLVEMGMAWWQGILTVLAGNLVVLVPMVLSGHAGTKFGVPFPVLARASFGIRGANVPSLLRALVACGWFGIQTWIGGQAIYQLLNTLFHGNFQGSVVPWLGISLPEFGCFMVFWLLQVSGWVVGFSPASCANCLQNSLWKLLCEFRFLSLEA